MTYDHLHITGGVTRRRRSLTVPVAALTAAALSLAACTDDGGDTPEFTEQPRTADEAAANGTMSVEPSASETADADTGQWLSAGDSVSVGWANAWPGSSTPWTFDEGHIYDVAVSNPRVFSETKAADPNAPADHPDSQASTGATYVCVDLTGKNLQQYEREVFSSGKYNIEIAGQTADHLTAEPATPEDVATATRDFVVMPEGPSSAIGDVETDTGETLSSGVLRPVGTDSIEAYRAPDERLNPNADDEMVEATGDGGYTISKCWSLGDNVAPEDAPTSLTVNIGNLPEDDPREKLDSHFKADTDALGWKLDL